MNVILHLEPIINEKSILTVQNPTDDEAKTAFGK